MTNVNQGRLLSRFNYATIKNFKTAWTYLASQETAIRFMNVIGSLQKKTLESFVFEKTSWLDNLLPSAPVRVAALVNIPSLSLNSTEYQKNKLLHGKVLKGRFLN